MIGTFRTIRTGIDIGTTSVKLVRGTGRDRVEVVTHAAIEEFGPVGPDGAAAAAGAAAGAAVTRLLGRLGLRPKQLGRVATAVGGPELACREVAIAAMDDDILEQALPFEARRHLELDAMAHPVLDCQVLGPAPDQPGQLRVLFAAVPRAVRDVPVQALAEAGLEPDVVDLEPLAGLNAVLGAGGGVRGDEEAFGLLDLGGDRTMLSLWSPSGGLMSREILAAADGVAGDPWNGGLTAGIRETVVFYRGRYRRDVGRLHLVGGGALRPGLADSLATALDLPVDVLDPLQGLSLEPAFTGDARDSGARLAVACGLCRWWDATS